MMYLIVALVIMLLAVVIVALSYRGKAKAEQRHAELQQQRAAAAESINANRHQLDTELATLHETHREETIHDTNPAHLAERSDFNNNWDGATGLPGEKTANDHRTSASITSSTGAAADNLDRTDLSE